MIGSVRIAATDSSLTGKELRELTDPSCFRLQLSPVRFERHVLHAAAQLQILGRIVSQIFLAQSGQLAKCTLGIVVGEVAPGD